MADETENGRLPEAEVGDEKIPRESFPLRKIVSTVNKISEKRAKNVVTGASREIFRLNLNFFLVILLLSSHKKNLSRVSLQGFRIINSATL